MPKKAKELSALQVRRLSKPGLHAIGGVSGLHMLVKDTGARSWILRVKIGDRRPDIGLGGFPDVTLEQARSRAREVREQIRQGVDPLAARRASLDAMKLAQAKVLTFDQAAKLCWQAKQTEFRNTKHKADWINSLTLYASPVIGELPVADVDLPHVVKVLEPIWTTKTETATRVRQRIESVLSWAKVSKYRTGENPARWKGNLEHALPKPSKVAVIEHYRALPWQEVGAFMAELRKRDGIGARALEFAILTTARSGEVRGATWDEIDFDAKLWVLPATRMKANKIHRVPLSEPAIKLLNSLPRLEGCAYVFPSPRGKMLSDMSINAVTRRMGAAAVPHGFRSSFKDWARSCTRYEDEVSELALAHVSDDKTRAAYARDELLPKRKRLMHEWSKFCDMPATTKTNTIVSIRR